MRIERRRRTAPALVGLAGADVLGRDGSTCRCRLESADGVVVDDADRADARRRQIGDHRAAEPAGADHQHPRRLQLLLARAADALEHEVAGIAAGLVGRERAFSCRAARRGSGGRALRSRTDRSR